MTPAAETPSQLSPDQERLLSFVKSNAPAGPIGTGIVLVIWWLSPSHSPIYPILGVGCVINWIPAGSWFSWVTCPRARRESPVVFDDEYSAFTTASARPGHRPLART